VIYHYQNIYNCIKMAGVEKLKKAVRNTLTECYTARRHAETCEEYIKCLQCLLNTCLF
jgi:hypothetical protein